MCKGLGYPPPDLQNTTAIGILTPREAGSHNRTPTFVVKQGPMMVPGILVRNRVCLNPRWFGRMQCLEMKLLARRNFARYRNVKFTAEASPPFDMFICELDQWKDLRMMVGDVLKLRDHEFFFRFKGNRMNDEDTLLQAGILDHDVVTVEREGSSGRQIFLRGIGPTTVLTVTPNLTVVSLKEQVQERTGISPDLQRLTWLGRPLEDSEDCNCICKEGTVWLSLRLQGGVGTPL